jgi:hypothetical protein
MANTASAVAALQAAGSDIQKLTKAIQEATFLDNIPGEDRQALRGEGAWQQQQPWAGGVCSFHWFMKC